MATTFQPLATTTLGSSAAEITFSGISSSYTDLVVVFTPILSNTFNVFLRINGVTTNTYNSERLMYTGASGTSASNTLINDGLWIGTGMTNAPVAIMVNLPQYKNTSVIKTFTSQFAGANTGTRYAGVCAGNQSSSTVAISSITLRNNGGDVFQTGTYATLYGILAA